MYDYYSTINFLRSMYVQGCTFDSGLCRWTSVSWSAVKSFGIGEGAIRDAIGNSGNLASSNGSITLIGNRSKQNSIRKSETN